MKAIWSLVLGLGMALLFSACAPAAAVPTPTPKPAAVAPTPAPAVPTPTLAPVATPGGKPDALKVATYNSVTDAQVYIALEKGFFKEQGIEVEIIPIAGGQDVIAPLSTGNLHVATQPIGVAMLAAADRGVQMRIVADKAQVRPGWEIAWQVLRKDLADSGRVKTPADLKGMKITYPTPRAIGEMVAEMMLAEGGLKPEDAELSSLPFGQEVTAHANKAVAVSYSVEPNITLGVQQGVFVKWMPESKYFGGNVQGTVIVYGPELLKNKELGQRWMAAYVKGVRFFMSAFDPKAGKSAEREEVIGYLTKYTPLKDRKLYDVMEMHYVDPNGLPDKKSMEDQFKWYVAKGYYQGKITFDAMTDLSYVDYAVQKLGKR